MAAIPIGRLHELSSLLIELEREQKFEEVFTQLQPKPDSNGKRSVAAVFTIDPNMPPVAVDLDPEEIISIARARIARIKTALENMGVKLMSPPIAAPIVKEEAK